MLMKKFVLVLVLVFIVGFKLQRIRLPKKKERPMMPKVRIGRWHTRGVQVGDTSSVYLSASMVCRDPNGRE